ncbi:hypothetical protein BGC07_17090 [Piscirickettsia litoralis]|uniref:Uncharacterized protein n=2 Tax=Piscirickettsia litoralis TaxID=1891921 RepID=A0ABX2ZXD1_9GAMM|nr:hypothetical protein BGC07_17090 [Piscirickettsia litoralis]
MSNKLKKAVTSGISEENVADIMDAGMDWMYLFCSLYNVVAPFVKPLALAMPHVGVAWNIFDSLGAVAIAANEGKQADNWAKNVNILSAIQLSACTAVTIASLCLPAIAALSVAGTATGGFGSAAATAVSLGLESRAVNLCDARIKYLVNKEISNNNITEKYKEWRQVADRNDTNWYSINEKFNKYINYRKNQQEEKKKCEDLDKALQQLEKNLTIQGKEPEKLLSVKLCRSQIKERQLHDRLRSTLKFCTAAMTAVAVVAVVSAAVGASVTTCGIATAVAASAIAVGSIAYRFYQKKQDQKSEPGNVLDRETKELNDIRDFVSLDESDDTRENSEKVKLYKKLYDSGIFDQYASKIYDVEVKFIESPQGLLVDESKFREFNQFLDKLSEKVQPQQYRDILPSVVSLFLQGEGSERWSCLEEDYLARFPCPSFPYSLDPIKRVSFSDVSPYVEDSVNSYLANYVADLAHKQKLTAQQKVDIYEQHKNNLINLRLKIQESWPCRKDKSTNIMSDDEIKTLLDQQRQQNSRETPMLMMQSFRNTSHNHSEEMSYGF